MIGTVEFTGFEMMQSIAVGQALEHASAIDFTIFAFTVHITRKDLFENECRF